MARRVAGALVLIVAMVLAARQGGFFRESSRLLWQGLYHDRSLHYDAALTLALATRTGDPVELLGQLDKAKIWPPVHDLAAAAVLVAGGPRHELAVLPSLAAWVATALLAFVLAAHLAPRPHGAIAGLAAAVPVLVSPAHRAFATDVMLESLGAALTLLVLVLAASAAGGAPEAAAQRWRRVAIALSVLFLEKYNYWLLVVLALVAAEVPLRRALGRVVARLGAIARSTILDEARHPLTVAAASVAVVALAVALRGPTAFEIAGRRVSLYPPNNLVTGAYALLFFRIVASRRFREALRGLEGREREIVRWHVLPVAAYFLLPRRLSAFLGFLGPWNAPTGPVPNPLEAARSYLGAVVLDYHTSSAALLVVTVLFVAAVALRRRLRPGHAAVLWLVPIAALLTVLHPNAQSRFLHSWIAALWIGAGAGLGALSSTAKTPCLSRLAGLAIVAALALASPASWLARGRSPEAGHQGAGPSLLDLSDAYLPWIAGSRSVALVSSMPAKGFFHWTWAEREGRVRGLEQPQFGWAPTPVELEARFAAWLDSTTAERIVLVDLPRGSAFDLPTPEDAHPALPELMARQSRFVRIRRQEIPAAGAEVSLWRRALPSDARPSG